MVLAVRRVSSYLRITDIVVDYFISFHSSHHIVPIHLIGHHIEHTATFMSATTTTLALMPVRGEVQKVARVADVRCCPQTKPRCRNGPSIDQSINHWNAFLSYVPSIRVHRTQTLTRARTATPTGTRRPRHKSQSVCYCCPRNDGRRVMIIIQCL